MLKGRPDRYFSRITAIDLDRDVCDLGIACLMLDIDNTIRPRDTKIIPTDIAFWIEDAKARGLHVVLLSNNCHEDVVVFAAECNLPLVAKAMKPLRRGFEEVFSRFNVAPEQALMIGDQISTDIIGAHRVGAYAYLVQTLCEVDLLHTKVIRLFDPLFLHGMKAE